MIVNRYRKIIHSYALIFRYHFFDELILLPDYSLSYTLDIGSGLFNCAMNCNFAPDEVEKALQQIENYYIIRQKQPSVSIEPCTRPDSLVATLEGRGYKHNFSEDCVLWSCNLPLNIKSTNDKIDFTIVENFIDFQDYLSVAIVGWEDLFDYSKHASSLSKLFQKSFDGASVYHIVGWFNNKAVCSATLGLYFDMAHLINISVSKEYRRQGIASQMVRYAADKAFEEKATEIFVNIDEKDKPGSALLEKLGFVDEIKQLIYTKQI